MAKKSDKAARKAEKKAGQKANKKAGKQAKADKAAAKQADKAAAKKAAEHAEAVRRAEKEARKLARKSGAADEAAETAGELAEAAAHRADKKAAKAAAKALKKAAAADAGGAAGPGEPPDPMCAVLATFRERDRTDFANAWVGIEPTFQSKKSIKKWHTLAAVGTAGEDAYFEDDYMLGTQREVAKRIEKRYNERRKDEGASGAATPFARCDRKEQLDQWGVVRQNLGFKWGDKALESFNVRFTIDPETFEYSIKPVPVAWFYEPRFVQFLDDFLWREPQRAGLTASIAHGGAQFSFSAKTFLTGSLLADDIASKLNHPELSTWIMDWPNPDDRAFRATRARFAAFRRILDQYWAGAFHPRAAGVLTVEDVYADRGFDPAPPVAGTMDARGPVGDARTVFQTNFAFGRAVRWNAQNVHPGYWQAAHPKADGYRPDQIMRYSEGNLNRLQIAGEWHVKSGKVLDPELAPELSAELSPGMLTEEASWEDRGQMGRTSARDFVEAMLLDVHAAQYLAQPGHGQVKVKASLLQDQLLGDAEKTIERHAGAEVLAKLRAEARASNLEMSSGRFKTEFIEPETLLWEAWKVLPPGERAAIAREIVGGFVERVEQAASVDPRRGTAAAAHEDPMEWHRHRVHPELWRALVPAQHDLAPGDPVRRELERFQARADDYLARRPVFSQLSDNAPPWPEVTRTRIASGASASAGASADSHADGDSDADAADAPA